MSEADAIIADIDDGIREAARDTGQGDLIATVLRRARTGGTDRAPTFTTTRHDAPCVLGTFSGRDRDGTAIVATDVKITMAALDIEVTAADLIEVQGVTYGIVEAMPLRPGGVTLMWTIAARK